MDGAAATSTLELCARSIAGHRVLQRGDWSRRHAFWSQLEMLLDRCGWTEAEDFRRAPRTAVVDALLRFAADADLPVRTRPRAPAREGRTDSGAAAYQRAWSA